MLEVCQMRIYAEDDRLLTGKPRLYRATEYKTQQDNNSLLRPYNAMSIQTTVPPNTTPIKSTHHKASSTRRSNRPLQVDVDHFKRHE